MGEVSSPHQFMQAMKFAFTNARVSVFLFFSFCTGLLYDAIFFDTLKLTCLLFLYSFFRVVQYSASVYSASLYSASLNSASLYSAILYTPRV